MFERKARAGLDGADGLSAFELAVKHGFRGTADEWLKSLRGKPGNDGKSAFQIAVDRGFVGTEDEWLASLVGPRGERGTAGKAATVAVPKPLLPARANFQRDPETGLTTFMTVALSDGTGIAIEPERDEDGYMTAANLIAIGA